MVCSSGAETRGLNAALEFWFSERIVTPAARRQGRLPPVSEAAQTGGDGEHDYVVLRGLTEVWELKGEGPCWKGLGLWPSGVAGEVP